MTGAKMFHLDVRTDGHDKANSLRDFKLPP